MSEAENDLGLAVGLRAEALGRPGQRRFRILVHGRRASAVVWIEKEELHTLAISVARLLEVLSNQPVPSKPKTPEAPILLADSAVDFKAESWTLGYDEERDALEFHAHEHEDPSTSRPKLRFLATREQSQALIDEALKVYSAGRPVCPLCGESLNPGEEHACPRGNGHLKAVRP